MMLSRALPPWLPPSNAVPPGAEEGRRRALAPLRPPFSVWHWSVIGRRFVGLAAAAMSARTAATATAHADVNVVENVIEERTLLHATAVPGLGGLGAVPLGVDVGGVGFLQPIAVQVAVGDDVGDGAALIGGRIVGPVAVAIGVGVVVVEADGFVDAVPMSALL